MDIQKRTVFAKNVIKTKEKTWDFRIQKTQVQYLEKIYLTFWGTPEREGVVWLLASRLVGEGGREIFFQKDVPNPNTNINPTPNLHPNSWTGTSVEKNLRAGRADETSTKGQKSTATERVTRSRAIIGGRRFQSHLSTAYRWNVPSSDRQ